MQNESNMKNESIKYIAFNVEATEENTPIGIQTTTNFSLLEVGADYHRVNQWHMHTLATEDEHIIEYVRRVKHLDDIDTIEVDKTITSVGTYIQRTTVVD